MSDQTTVPGVDLAELRAKAEAAKNEWGTGDWTTVEGDRQSRIANLTRPFVATDDEHGSVLLIDPWAERWHAERPSAVTIHAAAASPAVVLALLNEIERLRAAAEVPS